MSAPTIVIPFYCTIGGEAMQAIRPEGLARRFAFRKDRGMQPIVTKPFTAAHLEAARRLSQADGWAHTVDDWALVLGLGRGVVALSDGAVVGTALAVPFGPVAMLGMIVVDEAMRGRGVGRAVTEAAMALAPFERAAPREWRLVATGDGLLLYRRFGFVETGTIMRHEGCVAAMDAPEGVEWTGPQDAAAIAALDGRATGMERGKLVDALMCTGRIAVMRGGGGAPCAYAALRPFGRGEVVGPVVAQSGGDARRLLAFMLAGRAGTFLRIDTPADSGLGPWLESVGLKRRGSGVAMRRGESGDARPSWELGYFALAAQALG